MSDQPGVALIRTRTSSILGHQPESWRRVQGCEQRTSTSICTGDARQQPVRKSSLIMVTIPGGCRPHRLQQLNDFVVSSGTSSGRAFFLFASQTGFITGWILRCQRRGRLCTGGCNRERRLHRPRHRSAAAGNFLYAADFGTARSTCMTGSFKLVQLDGSFSDRNIPDSFSPFNIQTLGGSLYVAYLTGQQEGRGDRSRFGFVACSKHQRASAAALILGNHLNAPWGMALAPADFGLHPRKSQLGGARADRSVEVTGFKMRARIVIDGLWYLSETACRQATGRAVFAAGRWRDARPVRLVALCPVAFWFANAECAATDTSSADRRHRG